MRNLKPTFTAAVTLAAMFLCFGTALNADTLRPERTVAMLEAGKEPVRIVAFGDSITGVYYHTGSRRAWCDMLGKALQKVYPQAKIQMINAGVSGHTSSQGLARMQRDVIDRKPNLVVVMFGMNDCARNDLDRFRKNMIEIVKRCRAAGAEVVLCTPSNVYTNEGRPPQRLAQYAQTTRDIAKEMSVPLVDFYQAYEDLKKNHRMDWALMMSEVIHPNMNGHRLFAEMIAEKISGKPVSLDDVGPADDALNFTLAQLLADKPVKIVAMEPYDKIVPEVLREKFPDAKIEVVTWPVKGKTLAEIEAWAKRVRGMQPSLVVFAVPGDVATGTPPENYEETLSDDEAFVRRYIWSLASCCGYGCATNDVLPVLPSVTGPVDDSNKSRELLAEKAIRGYDSKYITRPAGNTQTAREIVTEWINKQLAKQDVLS